MRAKKAPAGLVFAAMVALALLVGGANAAVSPTINAGITSTRDLSMTFADGTFIGTPNAPGPVIPPGTYTLNVSDESDIANFDLVGPGVSMATTVDQDDFLVTATWTVTFEPCGVYSYSSDTQAGSNIWFQTSASADSLTACASFGAGATTTAPAPSPAPTGAGKTASAGPAKTTKPKSGKPAALPLRGTLDAAVAAGGTLSLERGGKAVGSLKPGRYTIDVSDDSSKAGFVLQRLKKPPTTVSGTAFVGRRTVTLTLNVGQWLFYPAPGGKKTYFLVIA
jgi:hypothetical protein